MEMICGSTQWQIEDATLDTWKYPPLVLLQKTKSATNSVLPNIDLCRDVQG